MTEKKNNAQPTTTAPSGQGDSSGRLHFYVPEGFEEKLQGKKQGEAGGQNGKKGQRQGGSQPAKQAGGGQQSNAKGGQQKAAPEGVAAEKKPQGKKTAAQKTAPQKAAAQKAAQPKKVAEQKPKAAQPQKAQETKPQAVQPKAKPQPKKVQEQPKAAAQDKGQPGRKAGQKVQQKYRAEEVQPAQKAKLPVIQEAKAASRTKGRKGAKGSLRIIPLGGLGEIGKNITVYETDQDMLIVDCGLAFPDEDLLGVDLVIPDFTYLERNKDKLRGIFITHGHEDHIGSLAYLLKKVNAPVYGTALTIGLIQGKLKEHGLLGQVRMSVVRPGDNVPVGTMSVEFIHVNHSIPDACSLAIHTPAGVVIQTGDFKIDYTPTQGEVIDLVRFGELGSQGVLALLCDSTNAEKPGATASERIVGDSFDKLFKDASGKRIIVATFASNVYRVQQIIDAAVKTGRKVAVFGRSMLNVVAVASELGYLHFKEGTVIDIDQMRNYTDDQLVVICTGSQGEPMSALTRMSMGEHRQVRVGANDYIIISATPIPGNEKFVGKVVNDLMKLGADVIYERMYDVHVSGHACADEIKTIISLTRPKYFVPVHGEFKHLTKNANIAKTMGYSPKNILISENGKIIEADGGAMKLGGTVPSGRVMVDGLGVGDVGSIVLRDRKLLSEEGLIVAVVTIDSATGEVAAGPDLVSRGFVYVRESEEMMADARGVVLRSLDKSKLTGYKDWSAIKGKIRDDLSEFMFSRTKRRPMILPVIQEV